MSKRKQQRKEEFYLELILILKAPPTNIALKRKQ
jgi:hypothetical protein